MLRGTCDNRMAPLNHRLQELEAKIHQRLWERSNNKYFHDITCQTVYYAYAYPICVE